MNCRREKRARRSVGYSRFFVVDRVGLDSRFRVFFLGKIVKKFRFRLVGLYICLDSFFGVRGWLLFVCVFAVSRFGYRWAGRVFAG